MPGFSTLACFDPKDFASLGEVRLIIVSLSLNVHPGSSLPKREERGNE